MWQLAIASSKQSAPLRTARAASTKCFLTACWPVAALQTPQPKRCLGMIHCQSAVPITSTGMSVSMLDQSASLVPGAVVSALHILAALCIANCPLHCCRPCASSALPLPHSCRVCRYCLLALDHYCRTALPDAPLLP